MRIIHLSRLFRCCIAVCDSTSGCGCDSVLRWVCLLFEGKSQISVGKHGARNGKQEGERMGGRTLLYRLIALTSSINTSSTLIRCFADVSMHTAPNCFARLLPSARRGRLARARCGVEPRSEGEFRRGKDGNVEEQGEGKIREGGIGGKTRRTLRIHLTFVIQITLVRNHNNGEVILVLDLHNAPSVSYTKYSNHETRGKRRTLRIC